MEMKWNPIVNGDFSEVPLFDDVLFTIINEDTGELYVICDELNYETFTGDRSAVFYNWVLDRSEKVLAWCEFPEPFEPKDCNRCVHWKEWIDEFGDGCAECELIENPPFILPTINPIKCPCDR